VKAIVIGCGRVGSTVALQLQGSGWDVTVLDENEDALGRLGETLVSYVRRAEGTAA
jgi:Trk K+ transport system NAD-binding subunit